MQTLSNYGFMLIQGKDVSNAHYNDVSGILCNICTMSEYAIKKHEHEPFVLSFIINRNPNVHGTLCAVNGTIHFGICYDRTIYRKAPTELFNAFCSKQSAEILSKRCYNQVQLVVEGKLSPQVLATRDIIEAWIDAGIYPPQIENEPDDKETR